MLPGLACVIVVLRPGLAQLDPFDQPGVERRIRVSAADHAANALPLEPRWLGQNSPERERACRLSLQICQREKKSHAFHDLLFRNFYHTRQATTQDFPVPVTEAKHPGPICYRGGFVGLLDDVSRPEGFGGVIRQRRFGGENLRLFSTSFDRFDKAGREPATAYGRDYEIQIQ